VFDAARVGIHLKPGAAEVAARVIAVSRDDVVCDVQPASASQASELVVKQVRARNCAVAGATDSDASVVVRSTRNEPLDEAGGDKVMASAGESSNWPSSTTTSQRVLAIHGIAVVPSGSLKVTAWNAIPASSHARPRRNETPRISS
jgi:hypothetical protein